LTHAEITQALVSLCPGKEWTLSGDNYADLMWLSDDTAPTLEQVAYEITLLPAKKADTQTNKAAQRTALLTKLGITEDEARLLLS